MTNEQILDRIAQMIRVGFVNARQPEKMRVKVTLRDTTSGQLITKFLPVLCPRACGDMQYDLPDIGDQVLCVFLSYGLEQGFVIGSMYGKQTPPVQSGDKWHRVFSDGAIIEYDRASHALKADIPGTAEIKCANSITLEAPIIYLRGTLINTARDGSPGKSVFSGGMDVLNGGIRIPDADVIAGAVSLVAHTTTGVQAGAGISDVPLGGGSSPGTGTQSDANANQEKHLELLRQRVGEDGNEVDKLIICLPDIVAAMAEESTGADKEGRILLNSFFKIWLSGQANDNAFNNPNPVFVSWDWLMKFSRARHSYSELVSKDNLFSINAKNLLVKRLQADNKFTTEKKYFDYISYKNNNYKVWFDKYFQSISVDRELFPFYTPDGLMTAMGSFMLRAVASGVVEPVPNGHKVIVTDVAVVATDSFNFDEDSSNTPWANSYRFWHCNPHGFGMTPLYAPEGAIELFNKDFRNFRRFGFGNDFIVLSGPHSVENFSGEWYVYP